METKTECLNNMEMDPHLSVDCVLVGFDGNNLCVLLVRQLGAEVKPGEVEFKLPGSLLYKSEELDDAAKRVITELTGLKNVSVHQFRTFGSPGRIRNPKDRKWLTHFYSITDDVDRVTTVAYTTLMKIGPRSMRLSDKYEACWVPVTDVPRLAFDHNSILKAAMQYIRNMVSIRVEALFSLLPRKFTISQLRRLFEVIYNREFDIRNFHKRIAKMEYVVPLDEREQNVSHRAARYYKFDKRLLNN